MSSPLPQEILKIVISYLSSDYSSLTSVCLTSRDFRYPAQIYLYSQVCLVLDGLTVSDLRLGDEQSEKWLNTIISNPELGCLVRTLEVEDDNKGGLSSDSLGPALRLMPNLNTLSIKAMHIYPSKDILSGCPFLLEKFIYFSLREYEEMHDGLLDFLAEQPNILQLGLIVPQKTLEALPKTAVPNMVGFSGNRTTIEFFASTRPTIKYLEWSSGGDDFSADIGPWDMMNMPGGIDTLGKPLSKTFAEVLSTVEFLSIGPTFAFKPRNLLVNLTPYGVGLRVLSIIESTIPENYTEIPKFRSLELLCITSMVNMKVAILPNRLRTDRVRDWFYQSPSLRIVAYAYKETGASESSLRSFQQAKYQKWERDVGGSTLVTLAQLDDTIRGIVACGAPPGIAFGPALGYNYATR